MKIEFDTDNAAFTEDGWSGAAECARILRKIADQLDAGRIHAPIMDVNGNKIGSWDLEVKEPAR